MNKEELKSKILNANKTYREGKPIMTDIQFDELVEQFQALVSEDEYNEFRNSLHETAGKIKHSFIMGSLDKLKIEEPENIKKFISTFITTTMNVSAKVDGISCRLHYENGNLISASTRGNGYFGEDLTDKIKYVKSIPQTIECTDELDIRGELVILKDDFAKLEGFANARNACAGIMNKKYWNKDEVSNVSFVCYTILGKKYNKEVQFKMLEQNGFYVAKHSCYRVKQYSDIELINALMADASYDYPYDVDGLVICDSSYRNEDEYRPDACKAVKINQLIAITQIVDIAFEGPSKDGQFIPVAILEPVQLGGATVSRATCHNLDYLFEKEIKYGSVVKILKSGDIIPKIIEVVDNTNTSDIEFPAECPCCGTKLIKAEHNYVCPNKDCKDQAIKQITQFIKKLGCKHTSEATIDNFKIYSFKDLVAFLPNTKYKTEVKLYDELNAKVFTRSKKDLLAATNFVGISEKLINKIVDFYGFDNIEAGNYVGLPEGVGDITLSKFKENILDNLNIVNMFINDSRYNFIDNAPESSGSSLTNKNGLSVCFTGKLETMSRSDASKIAENAGFEVKTSVTKGLTYLVTNDADTNSSKGKNARKHGVKIINEKEFLAMCNNVAEDIMSL